MVNSEQRTHLLKTLPEYFRAVARGDKTFEVRKNDRDFKVGDCVTLREFDGKEYTGKHITREIYYILPGGDYGIAPDYVVMAIGRMRLFESEPL